MQKSNKQRTENKYIMHKITINNAQKAIYNAKKTNIQCTKSNI